MKTSRSVLYQCPFDEAITCTMDDPCLGCEDFGGEEIIPEKKKKVKLYKYAYKYKGAWYEDDEFYQFDSDFTDNCGYEHDDFKCIPNTMIEVEED